MKQTFTRKDLRSGDIVELRNGSLGVVILEEDLIVYQFEGTDSLSIDFKEDLRSDERRFDIVKVYRNTMGFYGLDKEEPIYMSNDIDIEEITHKQPVNKKSENLITILSQAFYGNRTSTKIKEKNMDRFILGYQSLDIEVSEPIDRTIIKVPHHPLVIIYNKYQEVKQLERNQRWYQEDGYIAKPLAIIPELDLEIYSRCIACRINDNGEFESIQDEDYSIILKYFSK